MPVAGQEWYLVQGEDATILFPPDTLPFNIGGWSIRWQLRPADGSPIIAITKDTVSGGLQIVDPVNGLIVLAIYKADTVSLTLQASPWYWELRRYDPGASTALAKGTLFIDTANATP